MRLVRTDESFRWDGHIGVGGMRVGAMMNWVDGLRWGVGLGLGLGVGWVGGSGGSCVGIV